MKQRISALFLILAMLLCQIPQAVFASEVGASPSFFGVLISDTEGNVNSGGGYTLDYPGSEFGSDKRTGATNNFTEEGGHVTITAVPDENYRFAGWYQGQPDAEAGEFIYSGDALSTDSVYEFDAPLNMDNPHLCAVFEEKTDTHPGDQVQMWVGNTDGRAGGSTVMGGRVSVRYTPSWDDWSNIVAKDGTDFVYGEILAFYQGEECTVYAKPDEGYKFVGWYHVNIEWGPGEGKPYEGEAISTDTSFTYQPGVTVVPGDSEPLRYVCAVFEENNSETCTVSFNPGTGTGTMEPAEVNAGEEYELPKCAFEHTDSERVFYRWSVNGELKKPGDVITVDESITVTAMWFYYKARTINNSVDRSTSEVAGKLVITDTRTGEKYEGIVFDEVTASSFTEPSNVTVKAMIEEAKEAMSKEAESRAGKNAVKVVSESEGYPQITKTVDDRTYTYFDEAQDEAGDYYRTLIIDGIYYHSWNYSVELIAEYTSPKPEPVVTDISTGTASTKVRSFIYTGEAYKPDPVIRVGNKTLKKGSDYTLSYKNNINVGKATVTARGKGDYKGFISCTFDIIPCDISEGTASTKYSSYEYTGTYRKPAMILKVGSRTLVNNTDYTLTYKNNKNVGTATVTARGIGNYTGTKSCTFKIVAKQVETVPIYRLFNTRTGEHFFTVSASERRRYLNAGNWNAEGIAWYAPKTSDEPIYRVSNPNNGYEHHYTKSKFEKDWLVALGWKYDGIAWYSDPNKAVPIYRHYHPVQRTGNHHYTTSKGESEHIVKYEGWRYEGIAFYACKAGG